MVKMRTLTYSLVLVVLIATVGLGWLFDTIYEQYSSDESNHVITKVNIIERLGLSLANTLNNMNNKHDFIKQWHAKQSYQLTLLAIEESALPTTLRQQVKEENVLLLETNNNLVFHYYLDKSNELLILKSPRVNDKQESKSLNYLFTFLFYFTVILLLLFWVYPLIHQLQALSQSAKSFGEGKLQQRLTLSSISYIRDIEIEFNHMAQRLENLIADVKLLSSAVSHDLRTPLARIRFGIDTLAEEDDPILRRRFEKRIGDNVDEMTSLVETLLSYARLDQAMLDIKKDKVNLTTLIKLCIANKETNKVNIEFIKPKKDVYITADSRYIKILINNILQNAINYGHGQVTIDLINQSQNIIICIADNGDGIEDKFKVDIFKPFVRGEAKNDHQDSPIKGHGVGLAMVKRVVDWHQGHIDIQRSTSLLGAQFNIIFPKDIS